MPAERWTGCFNADESLEKGRKYKRFVFILLSFCISVGENVSSNIKGQTNTHIQWGDRVCVYVWHFPVYLLFAAPGFHTLDEETNNRTAKKGHAYNTV